MVIGFGVTGIFPPHLLRDEECEELTAMNHGR
jgi:hypothetical protein